jgi:hypothetical protein
MAKKTLLDIVQEILADSDGDNVNSIADTVESDQCARLVRSTFDDIVVNNADLLSWSGISKMDATGASTPTTLTRPEGLVEIEWIRYDKRLTAGADPDFQPIRYLAPDDFMDVSDSLNASDTNVSTFTTASGVVVNIRNDVAPNYWTILEGYDSIVFDSYDSALETNLQQSKNVVYGRSLPTLSLTDAAVPDLPENLARLLVNSSKTYFFDLYKGGAPAGVSKRSRNSEVRAQRLRFIATNRDTRTGPYYGRK